MKVLAVELPSPCQYECTFCCSSNHGEGSTDAVLEAVRQHWRNCDELYITGNGETGRSPAFPLLVDAALYRGIKVSILGASSLSVRPGLTRAEISTNPKIPEGATRHAANTARRYGVPYVMSMVDEGDGALPNPFEVMEKFGAVGFIVRAKRAEGRSSESAGTTQIFQVPGVNLGAFPNPAFKGLEGLGVQPICIGPFGKEQPALGEAHVIR